MPVRVFEDVLEVQAPLVEPVPFGDLGSYPLPGLRLGSGSSRLSLGVVVLENEEMRAVLCPSLGMRVIALFDKTAGREVVVAPGALSPVSSGRRGLWMQHGVQVSLDAESDSMSRCEFLVHEPSDEDGAGAVMMFGCVPGIALALQTCFTLHPGSRELLVEARVFNRSLAPHVFAIEVFVGSEGCEVNDDVVRFANGAVLSLAHGVNDGPGLCHSRMAYGLLAPRDTRAFRTVLSFDAAPREFDAAFFESEAMLSFFVPSDDVLQTHAVEEPESCPVSLRGAAHLRAATKCSLRGDHRAALEHVDAALTTLGDDPLTWWHRAALLRLIGEEDNSLELTHAHALAPMDPVLRAEAFLSVPQQIGKEPTTVLLPLVEDPDALHEVVHLLLEAGLTQEASRLIDEALRHKEFPLLRYVYAWNLYKSTRMQIEAANEVSKAAKAPIEPPFPWRPLEIEAVNGLAGAFPNDVRLQTLKALLDKRSGPAN